jgi:hypothetical protein
MGFSISHMVKDFFPFSISAVSVGSILREMTAREASYMESGREAVVAYSRNFSGNSLEELPKRNLIFPVAL